MIRTAIASALAVVLFATGCASTPHRAPPALITSPSGLAYVVVEPGGGDAAVWGDTVTVHESTAQLDGRLVFSSWDTGQPLSITLGANQVVDGMEELLVGMRVGETREAVMPPSITRRSRYPEARDGAPPLFTRDDTLRYRVRLLAIE